MAYHILIFASLIATQLAYSSTSYLDSARNNLRLRVASVDNELASINSQTRPEEVKQVRKDLGLVKIELDLYCPLFNDKKSRLGQLRDAVDEGYEALGHFKDLYDSSVVADLAIDQKLEAQRREIVLTWIDQYNSLNPLSLMNSILELDNKVDKCQHQEKFLWSKIKWLPKAQSDFSEVLEKLYRELAREYQSDLKKLVVIKSILPKKEEERFHDFRKGIRTILKIIDLYPKDFSIFINSEIKNELELVVDRFGEINDLLVAYHRASKKDAKKLEREIKENWSELRLELEKVNIKRLLY